MTGVTDSLARGINGDPSALGIDRAVIELRRGRAVAISNDDGQTLVVAALEMASPDMLARMLATSRQTVLLLTSERAQAAGLNGTTVGAVAIPIRRPADLGPLRTYAGMARLPAELESGFDVETWNGSKPLAAAGFRLAKAGKLVPALVGFETEQFDDPSVVRLALPALRQRTDLNGHRLVRVSESRLPLTGAENTSIMLFRDELSDNQHVAVVIGDLDTEVPVPVRMHSACLTGDVLGSLRCDCGEQLQKAVLR
ncbi:MAG: hypothetical protein R3305_05635, partial [Gammaproteobacteria bacterium]|nr:hypothetical protein [Gammaproteobacteria bacterium]